MNHNPSDKFLEAYKKACDDAMEHPENYNDIFEGYENNHQKALGLIDWQNDRIKQLEAHDQRMAKLFLNKDFYLSDEAEYFINGLGYRKQSEGEWIFNWSGMCLEGTDAPLSYKCSLCDEYATDPFSFCPNCGAKMKGGAE